MASPEITGRGAGGGVGGGPLGALRAAPPSGPPRNRFRSDEEARSVGPAARRGPGEEGPGRFGTRGMQRHCIRGDPVAARSLPAVRGVTAPSERTSPQESPRHPGRCTALRGRGGLQGEHIRLCVPAAGVTMLPHIPAPAPQHQIFHFFLLPLLFFFSPCAFIS